MQIEGYQVHFLQINWQSKKSCCSILKFFKVSPGHTVKDMELFDATVSPHFSSDQARLWACGCGDVSTPSFGSHFNPISTRGGRLCPPYTGVHTKF